MDLPEPGAQTVQSEAVDVLARCSNPADTAGHATGLVVGYVQSGKTLSFTTVATLARDNGYRLVIVVTGISLPLFHQSLDRLTEDLKLDSDTARNSWALFTSPNPKEDLQRLEAALDRWHDADVPASQRATVLVVVMKNHIHLKALNRLLRRVSQRLVTTPALIIDDEADQAGLNTLARVGDESTTYQRLLTLRSLLPHHDYLQYTATPQAPLLISLIDQLSPDFACVLTPGADYTGGQVFFRHGVKLLRAIPQGEIAQPGGFTGQDPPETLLRSLRVFLVGVAAGFVVDNAEGNRSMLVHPSQRTSDHALFRSWVQETLRQWRFTLETNEEDLDRQELLADFKIAYDELALTVNKLPEWLQITAQLRRACRETMVVEVNARGQSTPQVKWKQNYSHVVVGGQALDRGVTIPGLTVTYMPRLPGTGNGDTIQQRARFFGYKHSYLGYCRLYLAPQTIQAYQAYVDHEEHMRTELRAFQETGRPLQEWKRLFFLDRSLKPTRTNVLSLDYMRGRSTEWTVTPSSYIAQDVLAHNRTLVAQLEQHLRFAEVSGDSRRSPEQRPLAAVASLREVYEQLLLNWRIPGLQPQFTGLLLSLDDLLNDSPDARCTIYLMRGPEEGARRRRKVNQRTGMVDQLFQGPHPADGSIYSGDRHVRSEKGVSVQVHRLNLAKEARGSRPVAVDVPVLAIWTPAEARHDWVIGHVPRS